MRCAGGCLRRVRSTLTALERVRPETRLGDRDVGRTIGWVRVSGRPAMSARHVPNGRRSLAQAHAKSELPIGTRLHAQQRRSARVRGVLHELPGGGDRRRRRHA